MLDAIVSVVQVCFSVLTQTAVHVHNIRDNCLQFRAYVTDCIGYVKVIFAGLLTFMYSVFQV